MPTLRATLNCRSKQRPQTLLKTSYCQLDEPPATNDAIDNEVIEKPIQQTNALNEDTFKQAVPFNKQILFNFIFKTSFNS
ncbi:MAG: hypothetical protein LBC92_02130 [Rickettsiales bacterium]|jgi:hypothetical protein|nr:hypothetical protein [Rickettsiales bacterium]